MQKSTSNRIVVMLVALVMGVWQASAQEPERLEAVLRFDRAQRDTVAEATAAALPAVADTSSRIACKLNRRRTGFVEAYDAVTLWNVRRVKVKPRRMRLALRHDGTRTGPVAEVLYRAQPPQGRAAASGGQCGRVYLDGRR